MPDYRWVVAGAALLLAAGWEPLEAASRSAPALGTARYIVDVWDSEDSDLPQNSVIAMTQTRDGYLWLGTLNGLVRFDGIRFTVFDENNTPGLDSSWIVSLFEDSRSNLWVGTETAGTVLIRDGQATSLGIGRGSREGRMVAACEDSTGTVWLYTADGQLWRYRDGRTNQFFFGSDRFSVERASVFRGVIAERAGPLWMAADRRLAAFLPTAAFEPPTMPPPQQEVSPGKIDFLLASRQGGFWLLADGRVERWEAGGRRRPAGAYLGLWNRSLVPVSAACEDLEGNLVVGTLGAGVFRFTPAGGVTSLSTNDGLSQNYILSVLVDQEGSLWVGTDGGGLNRVKRRVFDLWEETRGQVVQSVCEDAEGRLWTGYNAFGPSAVGVTMRAGEVVRSFGAGQGLFISSVRSVFADRSGRVWAGTRRGLFQHVLGAFRQVPGPEVLGREISAIYQDRRGRLWVGTQGGLARLDEPEWKAITVPGESTPDQVHALAEDAEGALWIGTRGNGLRRLHEGQFTSFRKQDGLPSDDISSLWLDDEGVLWVGTFGSGLARMHRGQWTRYTRREGLISNSVGYLVEDAQGSLWIGSNAGLMRVRKKSLNDFAAGLTNVVTGRAYGKDDGLPTRECTLGFQPGAWRGRDGKLWFPTIKGLASVDPARLHVNTNPPPVKIESVLIEGRLQESNLLRTAGASVTMPAGRERLEIHYTSLNLAAPERARFRYRLEGHESAWNDEANVRVARYRRLPPGDYQFHVTACNEDGVWNEAGSSLAVVIEPPFWQTWWFLTLSAVALLAAVVAVVHFISTQKLHRQLEQLRQQEVLEKERGRIARDIHDQLGANLTQVALLGELVESDKNAPGEVESHARQISQTARETQRALDEIVWTVNPSNDTLEGLINYICKHAQEYLAVAGLRYRLDVPAQLPQAQISPEVRHNVFLAAKEAITNIVRHAQATSAWVRLKVDSDRFTLEIQDDGRGPAGMEEKRAQSRNGLRNMARRMEDVGGRFAIGPAPEHGTLVRLTAPFARGHT